MADITLNVEVRERTGTGGAREARREGKVPGVLYGGVREPVAIAVNENAFRKALYTGKLLGHLITLKYGNETQPVIARDVLGNPAWTTSYTPYQAEISQGRLEMLLNFQQAIMDLTAMPVCNASLLDEATAAAEAMTLAKRAGKSKGTTLYVAQDVHPQTIDVIRTRAEYFGYDIVTGPADAELPEGTFAALVQTPGTYGDLHDLSPIAERVHASVEPGRHVHLVLENEDNRASLLTAGGNLRAELGDGIISGINPQRDARRVAGHGAHERENDEGGEKKREHKAQQRPD